MDKQTFLTLYQKKYKTLPARAQSDLQVLLAFIAADPAFTSSDAPKTYAPFKSAHHLRQAAYLLATTKHETANTFAPIEEYGRGKGRPYGKPDPKTGHAYYGRGYVQLTWSKNYQTVGKALGLPLYAKPEMALKYDVAYKIMSYGMTHGAFTGVALSRYITDQRTDYLNARKIINSLDRAELIAGYATAIEQMLLSSL